MPKPKKFFKSRDPPEAAQTTYSPPKQEATYENKKGTRGGANTRSTTSPKKFFSSKNSTSEKTVLTSNANNAKRDDSKPPIVLRICRGKSQLLNDSDESESTPTPSSTPSTSTSPRTLRDSASKSPSSARITRSTRRSMQQDPSSSPATADTPGEFPFFSSPRNNESDLSPQYIPAEKYELERKAMYDNLLRPNSPKKETAPEDETSLDIETPETANMETESMEICSEDEDQKRLIECEETPISFENSTAKVPEEPVKKPRLEEYTDSDSNSMESSEKHEDLAIEEVKEEIPEKPPETAPPVKLIISKKKGSIFKSRAMVPDGGKKRHALYKHKWCDDKDTAQKSNETQEDSKTPSSSNYDFDFKDEPLARVTRSSASNDDEAVTGVKCTKTDKGVCAKPYVKFNVLTFCLFSTTRSCGM